VALAALVTVACGGSMPASTTRDLPKTGLVLVSLVDGSQRASATVGSDPVAVTVSEDGTMAYMADSSPGDVYAVRLPSLSVAWKQHVGGAPFGFLISGGRLLVSLFSGAVVVELDPKSGVVMDSHSVAQGPAAMAVAADGRVVVASTSGRLSYLDGSSVQAGKGFGVAVVGTQTWTADFQGAQLVRAGDDHQVNLPLPVSPFWLAPGGPSTLLVSAEGPHEDSDPGAVFSFDTTTETFAILARPRDPDQVVGWGSKVLVASHGDREVLAIDGGMTSTWAAGAEVVAIAPDAPLNLLVLAVNAHE
jgi:DNA-binding beta-propeller fold protein YncE